MNQEKIRFGMIGAGMVAPHHAKALSQIPEAELVAVADQIESRAKSLAEKYTAKWYTDYHKLLEKEDIQVVDICTPPFSHLEVAIAAAEAGKHVIVEKPIDIDLDRADKIIAVCQKNRVKLSVISQLRFQDSSLLLRKAVEEGRFGRLVQGDAYIKWYRPQSYYDEGGWRSRWDGAGGGALMTQGIHFVDLLRWLMGPVDSVYAQIGALAHDIEVEDLAAALLKFKNGALGVIQGATACYPGFPARLEIHGTEGTAVLEGDQMRVWRFQGMKEKESQKIERPASGALGAAEPMAIPIEPFRRQLADVIEAIKTDREPLVSGSEGRAALELVLAVYQSAKEGRVIKL